MRTALGLGIGLCFGTGSAGGSEPPAEAPEPTLTAPTDGTIWLRGSTVTVSGTVEDAIDEMRFVANPGGGETLLASDDADPYSQNYVVALAAGTHDIVARSVLGADTTDSDPPAEVTVRDVVAFGSVGSVVNSSTASIDVPFPAGIQAGDLLVLVITSKPQTNTPGTPGTWTAPSNATQTGGSGVGVDAALIRCTVFTLEATGSESGTVTVATTSATSTLGVMLRYTKTGGTWSVAAHNGNDNTGGSTAFAVTAGSDPGEQAGDMVVVASAMNTDAFSFASEALTVPGCTVASNDQRAEQGTTAGGDSLVLVTDHRITAGTSSGAPSFAATASGSTADAPCGPAVFLRLRAA